MEKELKKIYVCVHTKLSHFVVHQKLTQHCKSTTLQLKKKKREKRKKPLALSLLITSYLI